MHTLRIETGGVAEAAGQYGDVVARVERARHSLLLTLVACEGSLGAAVQDTMVDLRAAVGHGLEVLAHDHRQVQTGLAAVSECYAQLERSLTR